MIISASPMPPNNPCNTLALSDTARFAVDLYGGKSATSHDDAIKLMQSLDRKATDKILQAGLDYLKQPGRKLATIGFSMGGLESLRANLNDPKAVSASVIIYGFGFDKIDTKQLDKLKSPVLVIAGSEDTGATQAAIDFSPARKQQNKYAKLFIYPGADHVTRNHSSMKERITTQKLSVLPGSSSKIFLRVILNPNVQK